MSDFCNLIHLHTIGAPYTWSNGWRTRGHIELRLDRSLCNPEWLDKWSQTSCHTLPRLVSDHKPLLFSFYCIANKDMFGGPKPFRFQSMWIEHGSFQDVVSSSWKNTIVAGCPMYIVLASLKACLRTWNKTVFGDVHSKVEKARNSLAQVQLSISEMGYTPAIYEEEIKAKQCLMEALQFENTYWREKSRVSWLKDGDKCSKFFHTYAKFKRAKAFIHALSIDDVLVDDKQTIADHVVQYYQELYSSTSSCIPSAEMSNIIPSLVTENDNNFLTAIPTDEEIKSCVFSMDPGSALGLDGFNVAFYQSCWHIVGDDVCRGVRQFFQSSWLYPNMNSNFIV